MLVVRLRWNLILDKIIDIELNWYSYIIVNRIVIINWYRSINID